MYYLLSYDAVEDGMHYPTTQYREYTTPIQALEAAKLLLANGYAVHIEPMEV